MELKQVQDKQDSFQRRDKALENEYKRIDEQFDQYLTEYDEFVMHAHDAGFRFLKGKWVKPSEWGIKHGTR